ncbi:MAG TPA: hypothetical protein VNI54_03295 [Thermoanaerobaculia bacterium]|nr:hypothetical protein [Thermoanaerobaculia bacterium]
MNRVTVTAYRAPEAARTAKRALDFAGIDALVDEPDEHRARVRVENVDAIRAGDVLTRDCATLPEIEEADEETRETTCPACDSPEIVPSHRAKTFLLVATLAIAVGTAADILQAAFFGILAAAVFQLVQGRWRCTACGESF